MPTPALEAFNAKVLEAIPAAAQADASKSKQIVGTTDYRRMVMNIAKHVDAFVTANQFCTIAANTGRATTNETITLEAFAAEAGGVEAITDLLNKCEVDQVYMNTAATTVIQLLNKHLGRGKGEVMQNHCAPTAALVQGISLTDLGTLMPPMIMRDITAAKEGFGANIDQVVPDLKIALTAALLRFHVGVLPRIMPIKNTEQPIAIYIRNQDTVYDLNTPASTPVSVVNLFLDPTLVSAELKKVIVLDANDSGHTYTVHTDGTGAALKFNVECDLRALSVDAAKPTHATYNRTDLIADGVSVETVYVTIATSGEGAVSETFAMPVASYDAKLTRPLGAPDSADRIGNIITKVFLKKGQKTIAGATSTLLSGLADTSEGISVNLDIRPKINLKTGKVLTLSNHSAATFTVSSEATASQTLTTLLGTLTVSLVGYDLDARFSEENLRKTDLAMTSKSNTMAFEIPIGRGMVHDYALTQKPAEDASAALTRVVRIGQDDRALQLIIKILGEVYNQVTAYKNNPANVPAGTTPGDAWVAGNIIKPYVWSGTLPVGSIVSVRDADLSGNIKQKALTFLGAVMADIFANSLYKQQLVDGAPATFKLVTSPEILANIIGQPHIHNHLDRESTQGARDGVEYRLVLADGTILECVTSTFTYMADQILIIPSIPGDADSHLNGFVNWDAGTIIGHVTMAGQAAFHRLFAMPRELPIPLCPVGALIQVTGMSTFTGVA